MKNMKVKYLLALLLIVCSVATGYAQQITVKGQVWDEVLNEPLIGVNVSVKGTTTGTITDIDGHFSLEAIQGQTILVSFIGYSSKEIDITDKSSYQISMSDDTQNLDEVVVIGYGTVRKKDLTGAVGSVKSEDMMQRPSTSI